MTSPSLHADHQH